MPELLVDISTIYSNTRVVVGMLRERRLDLVAVTKGCLGEPRVARAMLSAGARALADGRDSNLERLRRAFPGVELHRIRVPSVSGTFEPGDVSYVTSVEGVEAVARAGAGDTRRGQRLGLRLRSTRPDSAHRVMLHIDTGDERDGVPMDHAEHLAQRIADDPRLELVGVSTNYACFEGTPEGVRTSVDRLAQVARLLRSVGVDVPRVSGGSSSVLWLLRKGEGLPPEVTELRCGEALLLGHDALQYQPLAGCRENACIIRAEVVEEYTRRSAGGVARRLLLALGRQDIGAGTVRFVEPGLREVGRSSDYLVVEADETSKRIPVGARLTMVPSYEALVAAWTSPYVQVELIDS